VGSCVRKVIDWGIRKKRGSWEDECWPLGNKERKGRESVKWRPYPFPFPYPHPSLPPLCRLLRVVWSTRSSTLTPRAQFSPLNTPHFILGFAFPFHPNRSTTPISQGKQHVAASLRRHFRPNVRHCFLPLQNSGQEASHRHIGSGQARPRPRRR